MTCVLELSNGTTMDVTKTQITGSVTNVQIGAKPRAYTTGSNVAQTIMFDVSPLTDSSWRSFGVTVPSVGSSDMSGAYCKWTCYTKEWFKDGGSGATAGQRIYAIENSDGTLQSIAKYTTTWYTQ